MPKFWVGDMFKLFLSERAIEKRCNIICVTTNIAKTTPDGTPVRREKYGTMGAGVAKEFARYFPQFAKDYSEWVYRNSDNYMLDKPFMSDLHIPGRKTARGVVLITKKNWWEDSTLELVEKSIANLAYYYKDAGYGISDYVLLPYPGTHNGRLNKSDVRPILEKHLDDRFIVCTLK